jgi:hypothetical protein
MPILPIQEYTYVSNRWTLVSLESVGDLGATCLPGVGGQRLFLTHKVYRQILTLGLGPSREVDKGKREDGTPRRSPTAYEGTGQL